MTRRIPTITASRRACFVSVGAFVSFAQRPTSTPAAVENGIPRLPMPERVVAIGDIHGDCRALARVLRLAGLMQDGHWSGGSDVLVQIGDVLDRGDEELECMQLLALLKREASESGGR